MSEDSADISQDAINQAKSGQRSGFVWPMLPLKLELKQGHAVEAAFAIYRHLLELAPGAAIEFKPLRSLRDFAGASADVYVETNPPGEPFVNRAPRVIGESDHRTLECTTRSLYVTCLRNVGLRSRSALIETADAVLLDYENDERARMDEVLELDTAVFRAETDAAWILQPAPGEEIAQIDEAFMLIGPNTRAFGHWISEYLPKYVCALLSGALPPRVPVLIDPDMPPQHREALELLLDAGTPVIEVRPLQRLRIGRLWCAPTTHYCPVLPEANERYNYDYFAAPPDLYARVTNEMRRRFQAHVASNGPQKLFLARKPDGHHRRLLNREEVEGIACGAGFERVYLEDHGFAEQLRLVRNARYIVGPEGSALFLVLFGSPGSRLCILNHPHTLHIATVTALFEAAGTDCTVLTGPFGRVDPDYLHFSDYSIDAEGFRQFLEHWQNPEML